MKGAVGGGPAPPASCTATRSATLAALGAPNRPYTCGNRGGIGRGTRRTVRAGEIGRDRARSGEIGRDRARSRLAEDEREAEAHAKPQPIRPQVADVLPPRAPQQQPKPPQRPRPPRRGGGGGGGGGGGAVLCGGEGGGEAADARLVERGGARRLVIDGDQVDEELRLRRRAGDPATLEPPRRAQEVARWLRRRSGVRRRGLSRASHQAGARASV